MDVRQRPPSEPTERSAEKPPHPAHEHRPAWWPAIPGLTDPGYSDGALNAAFPGEPLPSLSRMPGHVLYGWRDDAPQHDAAARHGHRHDSTKVGNSTFPAAWTDQRIVDAVRSTVEDPDEYLPPRSRPGRAERRTVRRGFDDVVIEAVWYFRDGLVGGIGAYPVRGPGVQVVGADGRPGPVPWPNRRDDEFREVTR